MRSFLAAIVITQFLFACDNHRMNGFSRSGDVYFKLLSLGDWEQKISHGDSVFLRWIDADGEVDNISLRYDSLWRDSMPWGILRQLSAGDSAMLILTKEALQRMGLQGSSEKHIAFCVDSIFSARILAERAVHRQWKADAEMNEAIALQAWLYANSIDAAAHHEGIYLLPIKEGKGAVPLAGREVQLHYRGYFLHGEEFDNTYRAAPLQFQVGKPDQVIKGFERALPLTRAGGKYKLIIPSQLAFGEKGSSTGVVPPYTTVIYELEVRAVL